MESALQLPIIDLSSQDRNATALSVRQACLDYGFFYLINHGVEETLLERVFDESRKFFSLPVEEKMKLVRKEHRGYTALYAEKLDPTASTDKGDAKESYYIGPLAGNATENDLNQWPSREQLPSWRATMESFYKQALLAGRQVISLLALALNLDENYFEKIGALDNPAAFLRLLHYPGDLRSLDEEILGASAHSDYGMITLLVTNGISGLQVCKEKSDRPQVWEDVIPIDKAFIVNVGDLMERWTNCLFRSTLHRVIPVGEERYSVAFFLDPNEDCVVECLQSCCTESSPPRYPPIRSMDYLKERLRLTYEDGFA
ncbi:1-aminocyclopropane-1-carboxylate oxidase-like isoform X1 [Cucumis melo var. makuwa]|uniref:1-aminocyclopropane-1-carboxylate oxidase-like isoform X1 n=2 Tax=Cucumis melo TaxID=3656 RepID=A0A5A7THD2_CUCMM|nr:2-oxoglutarate-Fe(II) type oxidoreductase hxnY-like isoform X1 [Cucumis melo]KAA0041071.1 1-aminocyclopropane-1-carboxylate oxidase-like isoform X1 [Cucumis melo var. makuwa]TYK12037.1 1-aminocyclopropane-1-carboxylate oxidase-like isoform X1 [Cucumis melo var. makuwa]